MEHLCCADMVLQTNGTYIYLTNVYMISEKELVSHDYGGEETP